MKKNVAVMVSCLYGGGAERIAGLLSKYLSDFYNVYVIIEDDSQVSYDYGGTLIVLPALQKGSSYKRELIRQKELLKIDCTISFMERENFLNIQTKVKDVVIVSVRTTLSEQKTYYRMEHNVRELYAYADDIVAVSEGSRNDLITTYGFSSKSIRRIYNFIDKDKLRQKALADVEPELLDFIGTSGLFLHIGRLHEDKNHRKLLVQFAKLASLEDVKLLLVGSGPEEKNVKQLIHNLDLTDKVKMISYTLNPFCYYKIATACVLTSRFEGMPNVLLEAMLLKAPVISVDCKSGPRELLKGEWDYSKEVTGYEVCENGILVENTVTDDEDETDYLCQAMRRMLTDMDLRERLIRNASGFMERYSNEAILNQWISLIENAVPNHKIPGDTVISAMGNKREAIVYGAGKNGTEVMRRLLESCDEWEFICFAVTDRSDCDSPIRGIPIYELTELYDHREDAIVVITVKQEYEQDVLANVERHGFRYIWGDV